ncbi:hypothetical protein EV2_035438 [Malus domestica]
MGSFPKSLNSEIWVSILCLVVVAFLLPLPADGTPSSSIYDQLQKQGLPIGLLPKGITDYSLNATTREFRVLLERIL